MAPTQFGYDEIVPVRLAVVALLAAGGCWAQFVRDWHRVSTPHFELVSRYDPALAGPLLGELEWARAVLEESFGGNPRPDRRVLIYIPDSPYEFEQNSPSAWATGFYAQLPYRDVIVLRQWSRARQALLHEYTHLMLRRQGGRYPAWFEEGLAEYFSTLRMENQGPVAGEAIPNSLSLLRQAGWLPLSYFLEAESPRELNSQAVAGRFYAQSWLYVHMLRLSPAYKDRFSQFQNLLAEQVSTEQALSRVYGKSPEDWDADARSWFRRSGFPVERLKPPPEGAAAAKPEVEQIGEPEVEITRLTLTAHRMPAPQARSEYDRLSRLAGARCDLQASLGDLAYAARLWRQAAAHYSAAIGCGAGQENLAEGLQTELSRQPPAATAELESFTPETAAGFASFMLGVGRFFERDYAGALDAFRNAGGLVGEDLFRMSRLEALAHARLGQFESALAAVERLERMAQSSEQKLTAQLTREDVERARARAAGPAREPFSRSVLRQYQRLDGVVTRVDCLGGRARFWVEAGGQTFKLLVVDPQAVTRGGETSGPLEFACGPQRREVIIGYQEQADASTETTGRIRYLEFR
ncbi:MAG: hypothetical protein K6T61_06155 [Bryobacteraceae bacterium]|nr:hypothetical protein [Bryobacteraceae bacterium]